MGKRERRREADPRSRNGWSFSAAAIVPCIALLLFCIVTIHEWWLIESGQIAVIPTPKPGQHSMPEVPAASLLPFILGSAALAAAFAYAFRRRSKPVLIGAYLVTALLIATPYLRRVLA